MQKRIPVAVALFIGLLSCVPRYIAEYDAAIDHGAADLQKQFALHFASLRSTAGTPAGEYVHYMDQYQRLHAAIDDLRQQALRQPRNELTVRSLSFLEANLDEMETAHRAGLTAAELPVMQRLFDHQLRMLVQLEVAKKREHDAAPKAVSQ